jgi:glutamyl/glutaminyl-tRNA synthetase
VVAADDVDREEDALTMSLETPTYRGRIAPSPTGYLHLGHARTFWVAQQRAIERGGTVVLRNEDLDSVRCKPEFVSAMMEDLHWFGFRWQEGPDCGGKFGPYTQSQRLELYRERFEQLRHAGFIYPCTCSRQDVLRSVAAPHAADDEPIYPGTCRGKSVRDIPAGAKVSWRFRVPDGEAISFLDGSCGEQSFLAGKDFGDFVVWRHDGIPSYQLAVVTDDAGMQITEVVRGLDLLLSTARQLLLYRALNTCVPQFFHCPLLHDESGQRLAKRHDALSLRALRIQGETPESIRCSPSFSALKS